MTDTVVQPKVDRLWLFALAVGLPVLAMLLRGIDANWDLRNYHLYNPHALLAGRMLIDVAPAQLQTFHNPLLDVPNYLLVKSGLNLRWSSAWLTMPTIAAMFCLLRLQRLLSISAPSRLSQFVLVALALTGAATWSTLANTMNDSFVAAAILGGLVLVLSPENGDWRKWLLAGLLAGGVMGLKLTASAYCIGLAVAALAAPFGRNTLSRLLALAAGGLSGFLITYGYWGWTLYKSFGNPFFPYFNQIFKSPALAAESFTDGRFRAATPLDALLAPVHLLQKSVRFSELYLRDPRLLIGLLALLALLALHWKMTSRGREPRRWQITMLAAFFISTLVLWAMQYGIYRYAATLELLGSLGLVLALQWLSRGRSVALVLALLLVTASTSRPNWGHADSSVPVFGLATPPIPANAMVLIATQEPVAYMALGLPRNMPLVSVYNNILRPSDCSGLQQRSKRRVLGHPGSLWLLSPVGVSNGQKLLTDFYGLEQDGACVNFPNTIRETRLCPQSKVTQALVCSAPLVFEAVPSSASGCLPASVGFRWSASGRGDSIQVWAGNPGEPMRLLLEGGETGAGNTVASSLPGARYELRSGGAVLSAITLTGPACN